MFERLKAQLQLLRFREDDVFSRAMSQLFNPGPWKSVGCISNHAERFFGKERVLK